MADVPHLDWPIRVSAGAFVAIEQDTPAEVAAAVAAICCFERGSRIEEPDFGITDPTFEQMPLDTAELEQQVGIYEPRAEVEVEVTRVDAGGQHVQLRVSTTTAHPAGEED